MSSRPGPAQFIRKRFGKQALVAIRNRRPPIRREIRNVKKSIKKIRDEEELKHKDISVGFGATANAGTFVLLNPLVQGDTTITRTADEVKFTSVQMRISLQSDDVVGSPGTSSNSVRYILFWDRQPNGAAPTVATLLDTSVAGNPYFAPYNHDYQARYKILRDRTVDMSPNYGALTIAQNMRRSISFKRRLARITKYAGNAGTIADIQTNSLYILFIAYSDTDPIAVTGGGNSRVYYKDD